MSRIMITRRGVVVGAGAVLLLALSGCSGGGGGYGSSGGGGGGGDDSGATISITAPKDHATVSEPFRLTVKSSEAMGPTSSGKDHLHLTFDGNAQDYTVETKPTVMINNLKSGQHKIKVTLQHADHSPVGPAAEITVTVMSGTSGGSPSPSSSRSTDTNGY
ncbi:hypothetical protein [Microlunatus soli]|uniref:Uncharacterized protein n=1 Tax=Microlunatus soli TaxID=630515 RepID=A0A1H2A3Z3_9ACTN|nr:hypothetical protein [Microlunatus soli]SDT40701.1 hypothetical protein SAMN04489812_5652 [Microlunatus soli]